MNLLNLSKACGSLSVAAAVSMLLAGGGARAADASNGDAEGGDLVLQEITVTATRRPEEINKVPVNITAYTPEQMDDQGVRQLDDIARLTPDLQFTHTSGAAGNNSTNISIRGVFSDVGAATTGVYIDDTPIQMRNIGYWNANAFPKVFDLERVEVLRGPQGTLFGAGAEGGAVRFITPEPGLNQYSGYVRSELADTVDGAPSYETGGAIGGPIIADQLGFRVSAWGREDGGYIDRISPDTGQVVDSNTNHEQSFVGRAALTAVPVTNLKLTASMLYQNVYDHDRSQYWSTLSNASDDDFKQASRVTQPTRDTFYLPALKVQLDLDKMAFVSNTSYFYHRDYASLDYTTYFAGIFNGDPLQFLPGDAPSQAFIYNRQNTFTEEARLQSTDRDALVDWTVGLFYSDSTQNDADITINGQATGVGGDLSARFKVTRDFMAGFNAGYVSLTYDRTIYEGANAVLVNKGDVIGGPPFNLAAWTLYKFSLFNHGAFYRIDYTYQNGTPAVDRTTFSYDPTLPQPGPQKSLSMRAGVYLSGWEVSLFGNNLTKEESPIAISHDIPGAEPYYLSSYRPLTFGVTAAYRF